eukprot:883784-Amphidinium_carterae.1
MGACVDAPTDWGLISIKDRLESRPLDCLELMRKDEGTINMLWLCSGQTGKSVPFPKMLQGKSMPQKRSPYVRYHK